jgi:hypothetical protein
VNALRIVVRSPTGSSASTIKGMAKRILDKKFEVCTSRRKTADYGTVRHSRRRSAKYSTCRQSTADYGTAPAAQTGFRQKTPVVEHKGGMRLGVF